ncbi:hypothetical protein EJ110_NYTH41603 [Nymphaea thermarum]|nr:hypothetical protein EJ110_NYTH41603 [Nymphaea thermarum]
MRGEKRSCGGSLSADGFTVRSGETRSCGAEGQKEGFTVRCCGRSGVGQGGDTRAVEISTARKSELRARTFERLKISTALFTQHEGNLVMFDGSFVGRVKFHPPVPISTARLGSFHHLSKVEPWDLTADLKSHLQAFPIILDNACILCLTAAAGIELADAYSSYIVIASSLGKEVHDS